MRLFVVIVSTVMFASTFGLDRVVPTPLQAADRVAEIVAQARKALGGEDKIAAVKAISATGPFRRSMGERDMEGTIELLVVRPDRMRRSEEMGMGGMVGGPTFERISVLAGADAWDDMQNRGGGGGGMRIEMRGPGGPGGGPGGPGGAGGAPGGPGGAGRVPLTEEQQREARVRRMKMELQRWTMALLIDSPQPFVDGGIAESPDGKADMLETKDEAGRAVRLFIDQATHLPLMVQYQEQRPRIMMMGGPGGRRGTGGAAGAGTAAPAAPPPTQEEMQKRMEEMRAQAPPPLATMAMHLGDYKKVDGVMLPHKIDVAIDGKPNEEWTVEKYKVNPTVKADVFEKKSK